MSLGATEKVESTFTTYSIGKMIGEGAAGRVYQATSEDEAYAIKILSSQLSTSERRKRFQNELTFCLKNVHPNIISVSDHGLTKIGAVTVPFYVMPLYAGSFRPQMASGVPSDRKLRLFSQVLDGVEAAHCLGAIHRDLKPENILIDQACDTAVVCDWGIARFTEAQLYTVIDTKPRSRLANFRYAAPEQRLPGAKVTLTADIYALGLILNEMFTGETPAGTSFRLIANTNAQLSYLDEIVAQMIRQRPDERPQSIDDIKKDLIGRKKEFVARQVLLEAERRVVPASTTVDPLISEPPRIIDFDWADGVLTLVLSRPVTNEWVHAFKNMGSHTSVYGAGPQEFSIGGDRAVVPVEHDRVQDVIDYFKGWMRNVTAVYKARQDRVRREAEDAERKRLQEERAELERRADLRRSIRL